MYGHKEHHEFQGHHGHHGCTGGHGEDRAPMHGGRGPCGCGERRHAHHGQSVEGGPGMMGQPGHNHGFHRRFMTRSERIERLDMYLHALQAEATAVQERIAAIKAEGELDS